MTMARSLCDDLTATIVSALLLMLGLQLIRSLVTSLLFYLRDTAGSSTPLVGLYAVVLFLVSFLAPVVHRVLGPRTAVAVTVGGVAVARLVEQLVTWAPADLAVATAGTAMLLLAIPLYVHHARSVGTRSGGALGLGMLLGIAADTALKGALGTVDLSWQAGIWPPSVAAVLAAGLIAGLVPVLRAGGGISGGSGSGGTALPLLAIGPVLLLELLVLQNIGHLAVFTEWSQPVVFALVATANVVGIAAGTLALRWRGTLATPVTAVLGVLLVIAVLRGWSGVTTAAAMAAGQAAVSVAVVLIAVAATAGQGHPSLGRTSVASGCGMMLMLLLLFGYYASYDIEVILPRATFAPLAAAVVLACGVLATRRLPDLLPDQVRSRVAPAIAVVLLVVPAGYWLAWEEPVPRQAPGGSVRVMSYNLHQGFGLDGRLDLAELAEVIEAEGADVVALQEVSRGWVIDGAVDMLVWLSQRLDMVYEWGPAADSLWGNAVLSRYPLSGNETRPMPNNDELRLKRSFTSVNVDVGGGRTLTVIGTHLSHGDANGAQRVPQVNAIVDFIGGMKAVVLMGDMNARPDDPEMAGLREAGLQDAFVASGAPGDGYTSRPDNPVKRIDYIWLSNDLTASDFSIADSRASDHLPVAVTVSP